jgi:hypothetical protein
MVQTIAREIFRCMVVRNTGLLAPVACKNTADGTRNSLYGTDPMSRVGFGKNLLTD